MIEQINKIAELWWNWMWPMFWQVSLLIVVVALIDLIIRKHVWPQVRYALWLLVLVKLVFPPSFALPTGVVSQIRSLVDQSVRQPVALDRAAPLLMEQPIGYETVESPVPIETGIRTVNTAQPSFSWHAIAMIGWMVTTGLLMLHLLRRHHTLRRVHCVEECGCDLPPWLPQLLDDTAEKLHLRQMPQLVLSSTVNCPAVLGLFRPVLLLPAKSIERVSQQDVEHILLHELAHIKRRDLPVHAVCVLLQIVYWFNPLLILVRRELQRLREMCCDATVAGILKDKSEAYSQTILRSVEWLVNGPSYHGIGLLGLIEDPHHLRVRLEWLKRKPSRHPNLRIAISLILVVTMVAFILPMAKAEKSNQDNNPVPAESERRPTESLHQAAADGDIEQVKLMIAKGADVNASMSGQSWTPLLAAAFAGHAQVVKVLLKNGAKVDVGDESGQTPLVYALWSKDEETVKTIISAGADINKCPNESDSTPLFYAVWEGYQAGTRILIDAGADVNAEDENGTPLYYAITYVHADVARQFIGTGVKIPALHNAVLEGNLAKVKQFIEGGTDVDTRDKFGCTPAYWALSVGQKEIAEYLLDQGADVKARQVRTLLHQASTAGFVDIVKSLIAKGADVDAKSVRGNTPLKIAAGAGHKEIVKLLIANGAAVNITAKNGTHPLGDAARAGHEEVVRVLLASGAEVNLQPEDKLMYGTALHAAARGGHVAILDLLIANGADVNAVYKNGSPLHLAVVQTDVEHKRSEEIVEKLLAHGANVNAKSPSGGLTPLHAAAGWGHYTVAKGLIAAGADVSATDKKGHTPLWYAKDKNRTEIVELLRSHGAETDSTPGNDKDIPAKSLHVAVRTGDVEQVKLLISQGADVNVSGPRGRTPLHVALTHDDTQAVKVMLENGAQVDARDGSGWTPLLYAVSRNNEEAVRLIISYGADVNSPPNAKDFPPLFEAVWNGHAGIVKALIDGGANVNARDGNGWIPLRHALQGVDTDVARQFIDTGVKVPVLHNLVLAGNLAKIRECVEGGMDVDTKDEFGWTPTYWALSMRQKEVAEYLLDRGASITAKTKSGHTLLHQASKAGLTDIVKSLIVKGVEVDAKSDSGDTPLKDAAGAGQESVVRLLIANGAGVNVTAKNGAFPLGDAVDKGHEDVVKLLIANGAEINLETTLGTAINRAAYHGRDTIFDLLIVGGADINLNANGTPLYWAANGRQGVNEEQLVKIVKKLLIKGADVNLREPRQGRTPLHAAAYRDRTKVAELLITAGAKVNAKDREGHTPLWFAKDRGPTSFAEFLRKHGAKE